MACFVRRDLLNEQLGDSESGTVEADESPFPVDKFEYKLMFTNEFPIMIDDDSRTEEEIIMDNVESFFNRFIYRFDEEFYFNVDRDRYEFPLQQIYECVYNAPDIDQLRKVLMGKYHIGEDDIVIVPIPEDMDSSSESDASELEQNGDNLEHSDADEVEDVW